MNWELVNTDGDVYYDLWKKFWGRPLDFETDVTVASVGDDEDDEESMTVEKSFKVLRISADLDHLGSTKGRLIVRQEYLDAVIFLNEQYEVWPSAGAVVIGHPGIGKSWFLYYLLVLRLSEEKKTILNLDPADEIHLFDSSGYYIFRGRTIRDLSGMARGAWALLDTFGHDVDPSPLLTSPLSPVFMVFTCSPNENRYKDYKKQNEVMYYVMDNWTFNEIWAGTTLRPAGKVDQKVLYDYFTKYGSSARTMYGLYDGRNTPEELDQKMNEAFEKITPDLLQRLVYEAKGLVQGLTTEKQSISHSVILVSPNRANRAMLHGEIITHYVFQHLAEKLFQNNILTLIQTYKIFANTELELGTTCRWIFEYYCHYMLSEHDGRKLKLTPPWWPQT